MPEVTQRNIRIPVTGAGGHAGHKVRTVNVSRDKGIKGLYCVTCKKMFTYLFAKNKGWDLETAKKWVADHTEKILKISEFHVDQEKDFLKLNVTMRDGGTEIYEPNTPAFILKEQQSSLSEVVQDGEHIVSVKAVDLFEDDSFTRREVQDDVFSVFGKLKESDAPALMEYRFTASAYSIEQVKGWVEGHDIQTVDIQEAKMSIENIDKAELGCVCPECGKSQKAEEGTACNQTRCKDCNSTMVNQKDSKAGKKDAKKNTKEKSQEYEVNDEQLEIVKIDKSKRLVYGIFLVPEKADHDGDVISEEDIEKVAHGFMSDYRTIDEMHKDVIDADIVESAIAWVDDMDYHGKKLVKGTWFGAVKVHNDDVWEKIQNGEYAGFSVRISGIREPIQK